MRQRDFERLDRIFENASENTRMSSDFGNCTLWFEPNIGTIYSVGSGNPIPPGSKKKVYAVGLKYDDFPIPTLIQDIKNSPDGLNRVLDQITKYRKHKGLD